MCAMTLPDNRAITVFRAKKNNTHLQRTTKESKTLYIPNDLIF